MAANPNNNRSDHDSDNNNNNNNNTRLYNPYQNFEVPIKSQYLYKLPTSPEYLFAEESLKQRRSWGENLTFYTGTAYLGGSVSGAAVGIFSGVKNFESGDTTKLKINRILNSSGHTGRTWGNRVGIVGLMYAGIESGVVAVMDRDDVWTSVVAGLGTGAVFRAARGVRSAAVAGALGGLAAGAVVAGKQVVKRYVPI
ncbi:mitochondrial import inner membrane translocase subunit TIM23-2 [Raphanus sativus]|uniref:Mitochondrial import inner membrane translocase subunit TIM23 n=1 Tax=Raphanus sativus TaxID=3726 RepID=A0A6J0LB77_RAPSA|nr:mitochondrial import inner membrane translocase subunit TIM23-2 [Raphanus sativus]